MLDHLRPDITTAYRALQDLQRTVFDVDAASAALVGRSADVGGIFHDTGGGFHHAETSGAPPAPRTTVPAKDQFGSFSDPDSDCWLLQEIKMRLPDS